MKPRTIKQLGAAVLVAVIGSTASLTGAGQAWARSAPDSFADLAEKLTPAVVSITTEEIVGTPDLPGIPEGTPFEEFFKDFMERYGNGGGSDEGFTERRARSLGSGFIVDASGYVVTNNHVVAEADAIHVLLDDGTEYDATVVGIDTKTDIALLKVEAEVDLPFVTFGDSDSVRVGEWALAIGNPFGFGNSVTAGIISARQRDIDPGPYDEFLQTDAPINQGNSGGPLFNMDGEVIGVNTAIYSPSGGSVGIGFAVPSNVVKHVVAQLREYGRTRRGWLGVRIQSVTPEIAEGLGLDDVRGALVASVTPDGPSAKAGLENGDVIILFDGKPITSRDELPRIVADTEVGKTVEVVVVRRGEEKTFLVELGELEAFEDRLASGVDEEQPSRPSGDDKEPTDVLGMALQDVTPQLAERYDLPPDSKGLVVVAVAPGSPAARADILEGDLILEVGQEEVQTVEDAVTQVDDAMERSSKAVVMRVIRDGEDPHYIAVELDN